MGLGLGSGSGSGSGSGLGLAHLGRCDSRHGTGSSGSRLPQPRVWRRPVRLTSAAREHGQLRLLRGVAGRTRACRLRQHLLHGARAEPVVPLQLGLPATVCTDRSGRWALRRRAGRSGSWTAAATDCWLAWLGHDLELGRCLRRGGDGLQHVHADGSECDAVEQLEGDFSGGRHPPWTPLAGRPTQLHRAETGVQQKKFARGRKKERRCALLTLTLTLTLTSTDQI